MNREIHNAALEARLRKQVEATGSGNIEEVLLRMLEIQEEQDRRLLENRAGIKTEIQGGIGQLDRREAFLSRSPGAGVART